MKKLFNKVKAFARGNIYGVILSLAIISFLLVEAFDFGGYLVNSPNTIYVFSGFAIILVAIYAFVAFLRFLFFTK